MLMISDIGKVLGTIAILVVTAFMLLTKKPFLDPEKHLVKRWQLVLVYGAMFAWMTASIVSILAIWGYDFATGWNQLSTNLQTAVTANVAAIVSSLFAILVAMVLFKVTKLALFRVGMTGGPRERRKKTIAKITMSILKYAISVLAILVILAFWGVNILPAIAGLGIAGLVIGLGAQKFINDLISGLFIVFEHHFDVGDTIEVKGFKGTVVDIGLKTTKILGWKGEVKILNNGDITDITNFALNDSLAVVDFGIAYQEDVEAVTRILQAKLPEIRAEYPQLLEDPQLLGVVSLADSAVVLRVIAKTRNEQHYAVERGLRARIKAILDSEGIEIPFPQVVVHSPQTKE